jgi:ribosomal protein S27AE
MTGIAVVQKTCPDCGTVQAFTEDPVDRTFHTPRFHAGKSGMACAAVGRAYRLLASGELRRIEYSWGKAIN